MSAVPVKILLVEDEVEVCVLVQRVLSRGGIEADVDRVDTREAMREALAGTPYDMVLCDWALPGFSGEEALKLLHELGADLPFILFSGVIGEERAVDAMIAGAHDYVHKDRPERLVPAIRRELAGAHARRERARAEHERDGLIAELQAHRDRIEAEIAERTRELQDAYDQLRESERYKDEFLSVISHELRTPLNFIMGFASILQDGIEGPLNQRQREAVGRILNGTDRMLLLVNDLLDFAKLEAGQFDLSPTTTSFAALIGDVLALAAPLADQKHIALSRAGDLDLTVTCDGARIVQVLTNLIGNAVKFTPDYGRVVVAVSHTDDRVRVAVTDTGIGMRPEDQAQLFTRFRQLSSGRNRSYSGSGLGLVISKALVEAHGGTIGGTSPGLGQGATFWFELPIGGPPSAP